MADKSALRRWKPFFSTFGVIDACIEAGAPDGCSRDAYRQLRGDIVEMLCDAVGGDDGDGRAEELCRLLDVAMAEALETLRVVPVTPAMLTTTDVAKAVGGLLAHESARVRGLARAVLSTWRASLEAALGTVLQISRKHEAFAAAGTSPVTGCYRSGGPAPATAFVQAADAKQQAGRIPGMEWPNPKKMPPGVPMSDVKRQRLVPEVVEHRLIEEDMELSMKSRSQVSSWRSTDERHFSTSMRTIEGFIRT